MIFYKETNYNSKLKKEIEDLVGKPIPVRRQIKEGFTGSSLFRLTNLNLNHKLIDSSYINIRCNFEKRSKGIIIRNNYNQKLFNLVIDFNSIKKVKLVTDETVSPLLFSPMSVLVKLGVPLRYARYFGLSRFSEYSVSKFLLIIDTIYGYIQFDSNSYNFYNVNEYFCKSGLGDKIEIIKENEQF